MDLIWLIPLCIGAYLVGNINFSIIVSHIKKNDIRKHSSGNPGSTNMLRMFGVKWATATLIADMMKGAIPALIGVLLFGGWGSDYGIIALYAAGLSAAIGHCFPVFYKFRGGKGAATMIGIFMVANPILWAIVFVVLFFHFITWEYGAIVSFKFALIMGIVEALRHDTNFVAGLLLIGIFVLILITHRKNIIRLLAGTESKASTLKKLKNKKYNAQKKEWIKQV